MKSKTPKLRFPEFSGEWEEKRLGEVAMVVSGSSPSSEAYNHENNGLPLLQGNADILNRKSSPRVYTSEITKECFIGDVLLSVRAPVGEVAKAHHHACIGRGIAAIRSNNNFDQEYIYQLLLWFEPHWKQYAQGSTFEAVNSKDIKNIPLPFPTTTEQTKIANFLSAVDAKIEALSKKQELMERYKKGIMQKIFSQEIRFRADDGSEFPEWEDRLLSDVLFEHKEKSNGVEEVHSVSVHKGVVNQIEHLGRSFAAKETWHYSLVKPFDIIYTKSPTGDFPFGIIKQSKVKCNVIVSPLYGVFTPETASLGYILDVYFTSSINTHNYLASIIQKGAKNTINITNDRFLSKSLVLPIDKTEQTKIANFLSSIDRKIEALSVELIAARKFKKALLQQMFA